MWIVIDVIGDCPDNAMIALNVDGENLLFDTEKQAIAWAEENCAWTWRVVKV
jgi:hypothetical protein